MGSRQGKSQLLANELKEISDRPIRASNPFSGNLKKAATHIEWLELVVTGLSHRERTTIAKIERHRKDLVRRLDAKDLKIGELKVALKALNEELKETHKNWEMEVRGLENEKRELTPELREEAERGFIKNLQTFEEKQRTNKRAYDKGVADSHSSRYASGTAATDNEWKQVYYPK